MDEKAGLLKAVPLTARQLDRWLSGEISRRILVLPFGGPIPSAKSVRGVDADDEWFDEQTDIYGPFDALRQSRRRVVDWHHNDNISPKPPVSMKGRTLGEINLDDAPEEDGIWADWWTKVGEANMRRIALLESRGVPLYGSSQAVFGTVRKATSGHIEVWPLWRHTITTAPINPLASVPPLKGLLDAITISDLSSDALKAVLVGLDALSTDLAPTSAERLLDRGDDLAKAGRVISGKNEQAIRERLADIARFLDEMLGLAEVPTE